MVMALSFASVQPALSGDYSEQLRAADQKVVLGQFEDAQEIYQKIIRSSDASVTAAYAHYKLGALHKTYEEPAKAKDEYVKGLQSLKKAGEPNHQLGKHLLQALKYIG